MVVVVVNKSLDSKEQIRAVFLRLDVNILVFYRFLKSFYPDIVFSTAAAVHADLHFRVLRAGVSPFLARILPGSELIISGTPCLEMAFLSTSMQFDVSSELCRLQPTI